jgi:molecular chaperone GrpE (heat shock protein)
MRESAAAHAAAHPATVHVGPPATPEQVRAIREAEADEADARVARLETKAQAINDALAAARAEAAQLRQRAQERT